MPGILKSSRTTNWSLSDSLFEMDWIADKVFRYSGNSEDSGIYEHII